MLLVRVQPGELPFPGPDDVPVWTSLHRRRAATNQPVPADPAIARPAIECSKPIDSKTTAAVGELLAHAISRLHPRPGCSFPYRGRGRRPQSSHTMPYRLAPADVTAIWRRTSRCVHELTGPKNRWSRVTSGTSRTAPPKAGQAGTCSAQTRFGPWLVIAIQPHASHTTSINRAPVEGRRTRRTRSTQSTRLPCADHLFRVRRCGDALRSEVDDDGHSRARNPGAEPGIPSVA
jgi:hypothetical protein